jgi:hypothetical protein
MLKQTLALNGRKMRRPRPTPTTLDSLRSVKQDWIVHEVPIRYSHLINLISQKPQLSDILKKYLSDIQNIKNNTIENPEELRRRSVIHIESIKKLNVNPSLLDQIYALNLSVQLLLDEWIALQKNHPLVEQLDVVKVAIEVCKLKLIS